MLSHEEAWTVDHVVWFLAPSPDGTRIAVGDDYSLVIYDAQTRQPLLKKRIHSSYMTGLVFSPDGHLLASSALDAIGIWDPTTGHGTTSSSGGHTEHINCIAFLKDHSLVVSGGDDRTIRLWDTTTIKEKKEKQMNTKNKVSHVSTSSDGTMIVAKCGYDTIEVYSAITWQSLYTITDDIARLALRPIFSPDSKLIFALGGSPFLVWDSVNRSNVNLKFDGYRGISARCITFSSDGQYIAIGSQKIIQVWNITNGSLCNEFIPSQEGLLKLVFSSDGKQLISGSSEDRVLKFWNVRDARSEKIGLTKIEFDTTIPIMTLADVVSSLRLRGCTDMTGQLDVPTCGEYPVSSGGFGDIYRCKLTNGVDVAVKTVRLYVGSSDQDKKQLKHAAQELYAWSKCKHPNVQPLLGLAMFRGQIGMVAEWESNGSMPEYIEKHTDVDRCVMSLRIAEGLSYLHSSGVIHGDLKGANVLVSRDGIPRLADFGNAKLQEYTMKFTKTSTKETVSSRWAAPELFEGGWCSFESDVYALGMTILEAITGDVPWPKLSERSVMFAVTIKNSYPERPEAQIPTYSEKGDTLWLLLESCWDRSPGKRPNADQVKSTMSGVTRQGLMSREVDMSDVEMG
ncbi:Tyrosine kinase family catalytic domain protein [Ceratobasidium sp. AG-Ba]|nr:Tyrosine kinase family catalytic domain protein [Ceratobasidium sp. AG-Ba]